MSGQMKNVLKVTVCFLLRLIGSAVFGATSNLFTRVELPSFLDHWNMVIYKLIVSIKQLFQLQKRRQRFVKNG